MALELRGVTKHFGGIHALNDCTFSVEKGAITCLVGPNGAGKTTIFNVVTGFLKPDTGQVYLDGTDITGWSPVRILEKGLARGFQQLRLIFSLSALDNVMLAAQGHPGEKPLGALLGGRASREFERDRIAKSKEILSFVGLSGHENTIAANLSYAEQKLLSIAVLLATGADYLLFDEPTAGLDGESLDKLIGIIRSLVAGGKTVLVVEHNMSVVQQLADQVVFLHQGTVLRTGTPGEIIGDPELAEIYFGKSVGQGIAQ